ncbi:MAG: phosphoribosylanthranilate isomerase [Pseudomonadota bacterium]
MADNADVRVKICGLTRPDDAEAAVDAGASYVGLVFFPPSPRAIDASIALEIASAVRPGVVKVALVVDPDDALLEELSALPLDMIQLHGHEDPARVTTIRTTLGLPIMKAIGVREATDLDAVARYAPVVDQVLIDAKPPKGATRPGGNAMTFDWELVARRRWPVPWMLAGGLTPQNVAEALARTGTRQLDVSSGVERAPGLKDRTKMIDFIAAAREGGKVPALR